MTTLGSTVRKRVMLGPEFAKLDRWQQLMAPVFPAVALLQWIRCWFGAIDRNHSVVGVSDILPLQWWGVLFLTTALMQITALLFLNRRGFFTVYNSALGLFIIAAGGWAIGLLTVQLRNENDTWSMWWVWAAAIAYVAWVVLGSLESKREELRHNARRVS